MKTFVLGEPVRDEQPLAATKGGAGGGVAGGGTSRRVRWLASTYELPTYVVFINHAPASRRDSFLLTKY